TLCSSRRRHTRMKRHWSSDVCSSDIKGRVIANEENLSEIHVLNTSSNKGVLTDRNGYFEIPVALNDILLFSSIQFEKKEVKIYEIGRASCRERVNISSVWSAEQRQEE